MVMGECLDLMQEELTIMLVLCICICMLSSAAVLGSTTNPTSYTPFNVLDYGATGDGKTDDSQVKEIYLIFLFMRPNFVNHIDNTTNMH